MSDIIIDKQFIKDFLKQKEKDEQEYQKRLKIYKKRKETGSKIKVKTIGENVDLFTLYPFFQS